MIKRGDSYIYFSKKDVEEVAYNALNSDIFSIEHGDNELQDVHFSQSWISASDNERGFNVPAGTWFVSLKVENDELWKQIKRKDYEGFSIEGVFVNALTEKN